MCMDERGNAHTENTQVCVHVCDPAVTACITGPDMVEWLQGELLPLPFSLIFHGCGTLKVKQTTLAIVFQHNKNKTSLCSFTNFATHRAPGVWVLIAQPF